ncbi:MAG: glutamate decarboxylase [Actinomadura sp.]
MGLKEPRHDGDDRRDLEVNPIFSREPLTVPRYALPESEMEPATAYQVVHDELMLDGNARLNLATFVTTWAEPQARRLMAECAEKNMIDKDEYPQTAELELRCVSMLARLWHAQDPRQAVGCSTTGSSEAAMLAGLALKRRWQHRRRAEGRPADRPNLVMGINVQVCWEKFANYFEVEPRFVPMEGDRYHLSPEAAVKLCDENTIGVVAVLGSTFDGSYEPVADLAAHLDALRERTGLDVPIHVDGASGAMIAPFLDPDLRWDFRLPRVASINASGHKYGLVMPGVGWALWRDADALPGDLVFHVNYLGGDMPTFALNFSRPGAQVVAQYYNFLRLGFDGYRRIQQTCRDVATRLAGLIAALEPFELITDGGQAPVFAFRLRQETCVASCRACENSAGRAEVPRTPARSRMAPGSATPVPGTTEEESDSACVVCSA